MAPKSHHKNLDVLDRKALGGGKADKLALGHEKVRLGLVDSGLRDMLEAFGTLTQPEKTKVGLAKAFGASATLPSPPEWDTPLPPGLGAASLSDDVRELARFGEALRVYTRDVQLSSPSDDQLVATLRNSIACFDKALELAGQGASSSEERAWLHAHRGATRSMIYWRVLTSSSNPAEHDPLFDKCTADFQEACDLKADYYWSFQFRAFLYALRGTETPARNGDPAKDDFDHAIELLKLVPEAERPASIQRHIGMLSSYNAVGTDAKRKSADARIRAACESIDNGLEAAECDQDEFFGPYSAAVSYWARYEINKEATRIAKGQAEEAERAGNAGQAAAARAALAEAEAETPRLRHLTDATVDAARTRALNTISQALAAVVGLSFVRARLAWDDDQAEGTGGTHLAKRVEESRELLKFFDLVPPDLETRSIFIRDPAWQAILNSGECRKAFEGFGYDRLRTIEYWNEQNRLTRRGPAR